MRFKRTLVEKQTAEALITAGHHLRAEIGALKPGDLIRLLRRHLHMTQRQLARRSGVAQSQIAKTERGLLNPRTTTLERIYAALNCDILILPLPLYPLDKHLRRQALKYVRKRMNYLKGTLALEDQVPDEAFLKRLEEEEVERLLQNQTSEIWDEE